MVRLFLALLSVGLLGQGFPPPSFDVGGGLAHLELIEPFQGSQARSRAPSDYAVPANPLPPVLRTLDQRLSRSLSGGSPPFVLTMTGGPHTLRRFGIGSAPGEGQTSASGASRLARPPPHHSEHS